MDNILSYESYLNSIENKKDEEINWDKLGKKAAIIGTAGIMALSTPSCKKEDAQKFCINGTVFKYPGVVIDKKMTLDNSNVYSITVKNNNNNTDTTYTNLGSGNEYMGIQVGDELIDCQKNENKK